ncbi:MAG: hypothetical protein ACJ75J_04000 [Cytophagaceae bacterium]|jgi:hypothetical protein
MKKINPGFLLLAGILAGAVLTIYFTISANTASAHEAVQNSRSEEYLFISYSNFDKDKLLIWHGSEKKEEIAVEKNKAVFDIMLNMMHSLNSEGWELSGQDSFSNLNLISSTNANSFDSYQTILFMMKRKIQKDK